MAAPAVATKMLLLRSARTTHCP